jgi:hypothetical protein
MATSDRKRKRDTNEEDHTKMDTEQNSSAQFPQINPSELKVQINLNKTEIKIRFFFKGSSR